MTFRPFPGLTVFTAIALAILLTLGTWQYTRIGEKAQQIARIDAAAQSEPVKDFSALTSAMAAGDPIDFCRVNLSGKYTKTYGRTSREYHVYKSNEGKINWRVFREVKFNSGQSAFVAGELVTDGAKDVTRLVKSGPVYISGYARTRQNPSRFAATSTPDANRWFSFNALKDTAPWEGNASGLPVQTDIYIDADTVSDAPITADLPVKKPEIPNNHVDYMLTWYSFALILLIIYGILHVRAGRFSFRS